MALTNLSQITTSGISTLADINLNNLTGVAATFTGNVTVGGTLTYDDVTNIDSVGLITARSGVSITGGQLTLPDSIVHAGNDNAKIRFPAADTVTVETGGSERLRITSDGDVNALTGHLQAQDFKLGLAANRYPIIQRAVQSSGSQDLTITGGSGYSEDSSSPHSLVDAREGAMIKLGAGDPTSDTYGGYIKYFAHGHTSPNSSGQGNAHVFYTRSGADTNTERLRITSAGKVGIDNNNPNAKLEVKGSGGSTGLTFRGTDGSGNTNFWVQDGGSVGVHYYPFVINQDYSDSATPSSTYFYVHGSSPFIVKSDGKVGIGLTNPSAKLDVSGSGSSSVIRGRRTDGNGGYNIFEGYSDINGANVFTVSNNGVGYFKGNVGIGTDVPAELLHLNGATNKSLLRFTSGSYGTASTDGSHVGINFGGLELWHKENNYLRFGTNNTERLRIDSSGNLTAVNTSSGGAVTLKIGANATTGANNGTIIINNGGTGDGALQFDYENSAARAKIYVYRSTQDLIFDTAGSERLRVDSSGRLLVGPTSTPTPSSVVIQGNSTGSTSYGLLRLTRGSTTPADGDALGLVAFGDSNHNTNAQITSKRDGGTWNSGSSHPTRLEFNTTADGDSGSTERLRITSTGKVRIGSTDEYGSKTVSDRGLIISSSGENTLKLIDTTSYAANVGACILLGGNYRASGDAQEFVKLKSFKENSTNGDYAYGFSVSTNANGGVVTERLRITSDGKVDVLGGYIARNPSDSFTLNGVNQPHYGFQLNPSSSVPIGMSGYYGIAFATNGAERLRITRYGKIGINNSAPLYAMHFKNAMASSPSFIHMEVTGSNAVGGGGGIAFDTSASNNTSNNSLFLATIAGIRNSSDDGSNDLVFRTSKSNVTGDDGVASTPKEKLRITSDGRVAVNFTNPDSFNLGAKFIIKQTGADISGGTADHNNGGASCNTKGIHLYQDSNDDKSIGLWFTTGGHLSGISGQRSNSGGHWGTDLRFYTHTANTSNVTQAYERLRIQSDGGISFNGDTAQANALDDYEEGTFTATCANSVILNGTGNLCQYIKIGAMVTVMGQIQVANDNSSSALVINNLPYIVVSSGEGAGLSVGAVRMYNAGFGTNDKYIICMADPGITNLAFQGVRNGQSSQSLPADANGYYMFNIVYRTST